MWATWCIIRRRERVFPGSPGLPPYWHGGRNGKTEWISQEVPDGTDWLEYMVVSGPETKGIPPTMSQDTRRAQPRLVGGVQHGENVGPALCRRPLDREA